MNKMSQGNKKIKTRKIPATNKELLIRTGSLIQPAHFKKIPATSYEILMRTGRYRYARQFVNNNGHHIKLKH